MLPLVKLQCRRTGVAGMTETDLPLPCFALMALAQIFAPLQCRAVRAVYGRLPSRWTAADPKILAPTSPAESRTEDLEVSPKEEDPEHDTSQAVTHMTSFGLPQDQPAHRQRSVFDTPPPSPPPS